jgi:uncharacterized protein
LIVVVLGYLGALVMGITLGLLGGGGSILSVPIFVYLFGISPSLSTAYSLFVVGLTALAGFYFYWRSQQVDIRTGVLFAAPSFVGVFTVRAYVMPFLDNKKFILGPYLVGKDTLIMFVFAVLMILASYSMIKKEKPKTQKKAELAAWKRAVVIGLEGFVVGGITGFVGAGGGFLIIPVLVILTGLSMKVAVGTSLGIIAVKSLFGFLGDVWAQPAQIDWTFLILFSAVSLLGMGAGRKLSGIVDESKLKPAFGYFVLVMGSFILLQQVLFQK